MIYLHGTSSDRKIIERKVNAILKLFGLQTIRSVRPRLAQLVNRFIGLPQ